MAHAKATKADKIMADCEYDAEQILEKVLHRQRYPAATRDNLAEYLFTVVTGTRKIIRERKDRRDV